MKTENFMQSTLPIKNWNKEKGFFFILEESQAQVLMSIQKKRAQLEHSIQQDLFTCSLTESGTLME